MASRLYTPPAGYYDLPFTWLYDGSALTDGANALNQFVYLQGGYGDFVLRRMVGFDRLLQIATTSDPAVGGRFQTRDRYKAPMQSVPEFAFTRGPSLAKPDWGIAHEELFPETGQLSFDLYNVLRADNPATAQLAFQGVRRMKGASVRRPGFRARPKTFTYVGVSPPLGGLVGADAVYLRQKVDDYDFELYNIELVLQKPGGHSFAGEGPVDATIQQANILIPFTFQIVVAGLNTPFGFNVTDSTITVTSATDGVFGFPTTIWGDIAAAFAASAPARALATLTVFHPEDGIVGAFGPQLFKGIFGIPLTVPVSKLWIYDSNKVTISSAPMLDLYVDGSPGGVYQNGALVPPVYYPKDSQIQIGYYSMLTDPADIFTQVVTHLVGRQWMPC